MQHEITVHFRFICVKPKNKKKRNKMQLSTPRVPKGLKTGFCAYAVPKHQFADGTYSGGYCGGVTLPSPQFCRVRWRFDLRRLRYLEYPRARISVPVVIISMRFELPVCHAVDTLGSTKNLRGWRRLWCHAGAFSDRATKLCDILLSLDTGEIRGCLGNERAIS